MDEFEQFLTKATFALIAGLMLIVGSTCTHSKFAIQNIIKEGVDPIIARCAIVGAADSSKAMCILAITQQGAN